MNQLRTTDHITSAQQSIQRIASSRDSHFRKSKRCLYGLWSSAILAGGLQNAALVLLQSRLQRVLSVTRPLSYQGWLGTWVQVNVAHFRCLSELEAS